MAYCFNCFCQLAEESGPCPHCGFDPAKDQGKYPFALPHGSILAGRYITGRVLGQGGFGITYLALDNQQKAKVAIKEFMPDSMAVRTTGTPQITVYSGQRQENFQYGMERFLDEAKVLAKFQENPHIVGVRSYFEENGTAYFVMEYVEGVSFKSYIQEHGGKVSWEEAVRLLMPVMDALDAVHKEGIIHRDVTPDNIFITNDGGVKLLDFGSARYSLGDKSRSLDVVLKAGYAPKEQYTRRGRQGPYTDVYSLSACLYSAITGYLPPESLDRADEDDLVLPSTRGIKIPQAVEDVILHGLEVQPADRYQSMGELRASLDAAVHENAAIQEDPSPEPPLSTPEVLTPTHATNENPPLEPSADPPAISPETDTESPAPVRRMGKPGKYGLIAAGGCILLLICLMVYLTAGKSTPTAPDTPQTQDKNLPAVADSLSEADEFSNQHPSEAMIVVVPSDSGINDLEDLFGKLIAISDMSAHYPGAYTDSIPDAISLYGEGNLLNAGEDDLTAYSYLISGMADASIMNCGSVRGLCFDEDGSMVPEVRMLDAEWTLESASIGKPEETEPESEQAFELPPESAVASTVEPTTVPEDNKPNPSVGAGKMPGYPSPQSETTPQDKKPSQKELQTAANNYAKKHEWENAAKQYRTMNTYGYIDNNELAIKLTSLGSSAEKAKESNKDSNAVSAFSLYQESERLGNMQAATNIGWCYDGGVGVERDESKAVPFFEKAAKAGNKDGMHALGFYYVNGYGGLEENIDVGIQWLTKSFDAGNAYSAYTIGIVLQTEGGKENRSLGFQWYLKGAQAGHIWCMESVGNCYAKGLDWGTERNVDQAIYWLERFLKECSPAPWNADEIRKDLEALYSERDS